jgi:pimeloyl-ACP methyl ester carboxylesterase
MEKREAGGIGFTCGAWPLSPEKPTLVFIHGAGSNSTFWELQVDDLADTVNTVAIDLPGHGASRGSGKQAIEDYAAAVLDFVTRIETPNPVPCGLSMGGAITQQLLIDDRNRFRAGILSNTGAKLRVSPLIFETIDKNYPDFVSLLGNFALSKKSSFKKLRKHIEASADCRPEVAIGDFRACDRFDIMEKLPAIKVPVLILSGEDDALTPPKYAAFLEDRIENARSVSIENAGHFTPLERPVEVNRAIREFLTDTFGFSS